MSLYFINPKKSTARRKLRGAAKAAFLRRMAKGRKKKSQVGARPTRAKRTRAVASTPHRKGVTPMAGKKKGRKRGKLRGAAKAAFVRRMKSGRRGGRKRARSSVTRRRRSHRRRSGTISFRRVGGTVYRRNPGGLSVASIKHTLIQGAKDAVAVVAGEAAVNYVGRKVADHLPDSLKDAKGQPTLGAVLALRAALAIGVGVVASKVSPNSARFAVAGALSSPIKTFLRTVVPADSEFAGALASDEELGTYYGTLGSYVDPDKTVPVGRIGAGGRVAGFGDVSLDGASSAGAMMPGVY